MTSENQESQTTEKKDQKDQKWPGYCRTIVVRDSHGGMKELVFPKALDLDRPKRARTTFSSEQLDKLEEEFRQNQYLVGKDRTGLAKKLGLSETQIKVWFQNRRTKHKKDKERHELVTDTSAESKAAQNVLKLLEFKTQFGYSAPAPAGPLPRWYPCPPSASWTSSALHGPALPTLMDGYRELDQDVRRDLLQSSSTGLESLNVPKPPVLSSFISENSLPGSDSPDGRLTHDVSNESISPTAETSVSDAATETKATRSSLDGTLNLNGLSPRQASIPSYFHLPYSMYGSNLGPSEKESFYAPRFNYSMLHSTHPTYQRHSANVMSRNVPLSEQILSSHHQLPAFSTHEFRRGDMDIRSLNASGIHFKDFSRYISSQMQSPHLKMAPKEGATSPAFSSWVTADDASLISPTRSQQLRHSEPTQILNAWQNSPFRFSYPSYPESSFASAPKMLFSL